MRAARFSMTAGLLALLLGAAQLSRPPAASARSCITNLAGDVCLAQCIGELQAACGADVQCHQAVVAGLQALAGTADGTEACAAALAAAADACDCD